MGRVQATNMRSRDATLTVVSGSCSSGIPAKKQHVSQSLPRLGGGALPRSPGSSWPEVQAVVCQRECPSLAWITLIGTPAG
jgi:hypothetical protein